MSSLIFAASSVTAAQHVAHDLRGEGFLARASHRGASALVIVNCTNRDHDVVVERIKRCDGGSRPISAG